MLTLLTLDTLTLLSLERLLHMLTLLTLDMLTLLSLERLLHMLAMGLLHMMLTLLTLDMLAMLALLSLERLMHMLTLTGASQRLWGMLLIHSLHFQPFVMLWLVWLWPHDMWAKHRLHNLLTGPPLVRCTLGNSPLQPHLCWLQCLCSCCIPC